ncbi:prolyl-tRNA synthetase [Decorospora gaudefroyi]|uniref:proline--tRNA ligase n=1 Tax=Decorospora gaudefroyi TaxID=184978 RepID=A0A6A5K847_9PLEO|nr:prolyl-tRNA synthetase [Decorospora gaudefroyi]
MAAPIWKAARQPQTIRLPTREIWNARFIATDSRNRLSNFWAPTGGISPQDGEQDESHALLIRGGFLRQAHSGVFHLLPLGLRVQNKLEALIDKHMHSIGASKLSLSSITTEGLWRQSGRYSANSELLRIKDRRGSGFLLSPTHEEEITALVGGMVHSYKDLPLRLYQIGRKYRDERRPRQGLLRAKEFMMKDLYTFDHSSDAALSTYEAVREAYNNLFNELKLPYLVADADSGNMGGKLSHEYHFVSPKGEDNVWSCNSCAYVANEELVEKRAETTRSHDASSMVFTGISVDQKTAINIHIPPSSDIGSSKKQLWDHVSAHINLHAVKKALPRDIDIDTGIESSTLASLLPKTTQTIDLYDRSLSASTPTTTSTDLTIIKPHDPCPHCTDGTLHVQRAIEVGHTFHLGTRYSEPLNAVVASPDQNLSSPLHMGCHGIGVSRIIGAVASLLSDTNGVNWPRVIAPYEAILITSPSADETHVAEVYDALYGAGHVDLVLDDRVGKSLGWKLRDADLIGYPVVVVLGRGWKERGEVEVQCRRLGVKKEVGLEELRAEVLALLAQL